MRSTTCLARAAVLAIGLAAGLAQAAPSVVFTATDIDGSAGEQWRYDFTVSGVADVFESLNLSFDSSLYAGLQNQASSPNLDLLVTQPDAVLPAPGLLTATFMAALTTPEAFSVEFTWLGTGTPGSLPFQYNDANGAPAGDGRTTSPGTPAVPEPQMLPALLALAGVATWMRRRKAANRA